MSIKKSDGGSSKNLVRAAQSQGVATPSIIVDATGDVLILPGGSFLLTAEFVREGDDLLLAATDGTNSSAAAGLAHVIFDQTNDTLYFDVDSWTDGCTVLATIEGVADAVFASDVIFFRGRIDTDGASTRQIVKGRLVN